MSEKPYLRHIRAKRILLAFLIDVIHNPFPYFACAIVRGVVGLNVGRSHVGGKTGINGTAYELRLVVEVEMLEQHGGRKDLRQGIGDVLICGLWP